MIKSNAMKKFFCLTIVIKVTVSALLLIAVGFQLPAQAFFGKLNDPNADFFEIQKEANEYFSRVGTSKGHGYKQYKRWEHEKMLTIDQNGKSKLPSDIWELHKAKDQDSRQRNAKARPGNVYKELGPRAINVTSHHSPGNGRIKSIARNSKNPNTIYVAGIGGVWKSTNGGAASSWIPLTDHLPAHYGFAVAVSPIDTNLILISLHGTGVFRSTDGGSTWLQTSLTEVNAPKIIFHPTNGNIVLIATTSGIYRSIDAGLTYTQINTDYIEDIDFKPGDPSIVFATGFNGFYRSTNTGISFTKILNGINITERSFLAVTPANPNYVYVVQSKDFTGLGSIYRSKDGGLSFSTMLVADANQGTNYFGYNTYDPAGQAWHDMAIAASPKNANEIIIGGINLWRSTDGGASFFQSSDWIWGNSIAYVHADIQALEWFNDKLYCGSDGGIFKSQNNGEDWINLSYGLGNRDLYRLGGIESKPYFIGAGAQDNGQSILTENNQYTWRDWAGGDGMEVAIDPFNADVIYACYQNGGLYKSIDGGLTQSYIPTPPFTNSRWVTPIAVDPVTPNTVFLAADRLFKSTDGGRNWKVLPNLNAEFAFESMAISPSNNSYIYVTEGVYVYVTKDKGSTWAKVFNNIEGGSSYISINPSNPNKVVVSCGYNIYLSNDAGATYQKINYNLPDINIRTVLYQKSPDDNIYVGLELGVYYLKPNTTTWLAYYDGLPNVPVSEMEINYSISKLRVATAGRGLWEAPLIISGVANQLPTVAITSPQNFTIFNRPATINITATARDTDGTISKVEFFNGATKIGEDLFAPYSFNWTNVPSGNYTLTAKATDNAAGAQTSAPIYVSVITSIGDLIPNVIIVSPLKNTVFTSPDYILFNATANNFVGTISRVEFYNGTTLLGVDSKAPFYYRWEYPPKGTHTITAKAIDNMGAIVTSDIIKVYVKSNINELPTISITSPINNASFIAPANVSIATEAFDSDGSIVKVEFFNGTVKLGEVLSQPFTYNWNNIKSGRYIITAKATDNDGGSITSTAINFTVDDSNQLPTISITSPDNNASYIVPANISIMADASDSDGNITKVEFYNGASKLGEDLSQPFQYDWNNVTVGMYNITAKAIDNNGGSKTSSTVNVTVSLANKLPSVSITSPFNKALFIAPADVSIAVDAFDTDGTISKVEFYVDQNKLGEDQSQPFTYTWDKATIGTYTITAKAIDNAGGTKTSNGISVTINSSNTAIGLKGPSCINTGQDYTYTVIPDFPSYFTSYWTNTGYVTFTIDPKDYNKVVLNVPADAVGKSFTFSAGVSFPAAPWYIEYSKIIYFDGCVLSINKEDHVDMTVTPSPFTTELLIRLNGGELIQKIFVFDMKGVEVYHNDQVNASDFLLQEILAEGMYAVRVFTKENSYNLKVLKQN
jgi:photosystem II stability/assembly factor-like uncharacterized protein